MQRLLWLVPAIVLLVTAGTALAQDAKTGVADSSPEVRKLLTEMEECFGRGDAKGLAACWTHEGDFVGPTGERVAGRSDIEKAFQQYLAARKDSKLQMQVVSFRLVTPDVALVEAISEVKPMPATAGGEPRSALTLVKHDGRWLIESARETILGPSASATPLKEIEWLVGDWIDETASQEGLSLQSSCGWTANRTFLVRKFKAEGKVGVVHAGTEVIGWDPRVRRIRSWVFDSTGGFGENIWVQDGKRWLVKYSGTLPDGHEVSATHFLTLIDANTLTLQSKDRTHNGERQPDIPEITIKRRAAPTEASKTDSQKQPAPQVLP